MAQQTFTQSAQTLGAGGSLVVVSCSLLCRQGMNTVWLIKGHLDKGTYRQKTVKNVVGSMGGVSMFCCYLPVSAQCSQYLAHSILRTVHCAHDTRHTTHNTQHTTHNTQHTTHNTQHTAHTTAHNTQHTTHNTLHTTHYA